MLISVRVSVNAKEAKLTKIDESNYDVKIDERAIEGRANKRLIEILSKYFAVPKSRIIIVKGTKSKEKLIEVILENK